MTKDAPQGEVDRQGDRPRAGRPRDARIDEAIRDAALQLLADIGYQGTTIQAVARRAQVSAQSIYRRWPTKAALVEFAILPATDIVLPEPSADTARTLRGWARLLLEVVAEPGARHATPGLMLEYMQDPQAWEHMFVTERIPMRDAFADFIAESVARRDVRDDVDPNLVFEMLLGSLVFRAIIFGKVGADSFADGVTNLLMQAIGSRPDAHRPMRDTSFQSASGIAPES